MTDQNENPRYASAALALFAAGIAIEGSRLVIAEPWPGLSAAFSYFISASLIVVWGATMITLLLRHRSPRLSVAAWFLSFAATFATLAHGIFTRLGSAELSLAYIAGGALLGSILKKTWDGEQMHHWRRDERAFQR